MHTNSNNNNNNDSDNHNDNDDDNDNDNDNNDNDNHDLIVAKLYAYGFDKNALRLVKSYLPDQWQRKINSSFSTWSELLLGIPQGSIL